MIVVVGLGNMGLALARRLHMREREVVGVDVAEGRRTVWSVLTGRPAVARVDELDWPAVERVILVVRTAAQVEETLPGIRAGAEAAQLTRLPVHVITTITPDDARRLVKHASPALRIIENPLTGGEAPALMGTQTSMIAGEYEQTDVDFLRDGLMEEVVTFDAYGKPALAKLLNNLACAYNAAVFATVLGLGQERGLDVEKLRRVVVRGSGTSYSARAIVEIIGDLLAKDVALAESYIGPAPPVSAADIEAQLAAARTLLAQS
jgi:2-hydroxy-3-oxopropionate reductase